MANFENFLEYSQKWTDKSLQSDLQSFIKNFVKDKGQEIVARTKLRTPVDTGALRNSWQVGDFREKTNAYEIDILNNQEYASYVEYGTVEREWKWKNGAFMLTKSLNEVEQKIHNDFNIKFTKFLNDKGIGE